MTLSNTNMHFMVSIASLQGFYMENSTVFFLVWSVRVSNDLPPYNPGLQSPNI